MEGSFTICALKIACVLAGTRWHLFYVVDPSPKKNGFAFDCDTAISRAIARADPPDDLGDIRRRSALHEAELLHGNTPDGWTRTESKLAA